MKKIVSVLLILAMLFSLSLTLISCSGEKGDKGDKYIIFNLMIIKA